jgi:hypothetical protein
MRQLVGVRALCGAIVMLCMACSDQGPTADSCATIPVSVSSGTQPMFSWTSECLVEALAVSQGGSGAIVWLAVSVNQTNNLASGIRYAFAPPGAALTANRLDPLAAGKAYRVTLYRAEGGQGSQVHSVGQSGFVP